MMVLGVFLKPAGMNEIKSSGGFLKKQNTEDQIRELFDT